MKHSTLTMTVAALGLATMTNAATWTVGPGGGYDFPLIQQAINASAPGDSIEVFPATYLENLNLLGKDLQIRANAGLGSVIVDGGGAGPVVSCVSGETSATSLEGLVLTNGAAANGGGLWINRSSPRVLDCHILNNRATTGGGAALFNSKTVFQTCMFDANRATARGGHLDARRGKPQVLDCQMLNGTVGGGIVGFGGAIHAVKTNLAVMRTTIQSNRATRSGGGVYYQRSRIYMEQCLLDSNESNDGGGMFSSDTQLRLFGVDAVRNLAYNNGGGMYHQGIGDVLLDSCNVMDNQATLDGAGILVRKRLGDHHISMSSVQRNFCGDQGAGVCYFMTETATVSDTSFKENIAMNGGGIFTASPNPLEIKNSHFEANQAQQDGGGLYALNTRVDSVQTAFISNAAGNDGGGLKLDQSEGYFSRMEFYANMGVYLGGACYVTNQSDFHVSDSAFDENQASEGGAILNEINSQATIKGCKIRSNQAWSSAFAGGGLTTDTSSMSFVGTSLICANSAVNLRGLYVDLGGNTITTTCP